MTDTEKLERVMAIVRRVQALRAELLIAEAELKAIAVTVNTQSPVKVGA